jgi:hypothetical protein
MTQVSQIERHLRVYKNISSWEAIQQYRCTRLAEYIHQLRDRGWDIQSIWHEEGGKRFVEYRLVEDKQLALF